ncbi:MAG: glycosyltransferase family 2 protein [Thiobacillus sp.]
MTEHPRVTAIAVCYNHARFVVECLDSIRNQTYPNVQIVIMDDCSQDDSVKIIQDWIDRYGIECSFIAHQKNQGLCRTLNEALGLAQGKYISMIATDDTWMPEKLTHQVKQMESLPVEVGVLYGDAYQIDESGRRLSRLFIEAHRSFDTMPEGNIFSVLLEGNYIPAMSTLIRTSVYAKVGNYDERLVYEDWDMWLRISRDFEFAYSPHISTQYRIVHTSITRKILWARDSAKFISDFLIAEKLLANQGLTQQQHQMLRKRVVDCANDLYCVGYPDAKTYLWKALKNSANRQTIMTYLLASCRISHANMRSWKDCWKWRWSGIRAWFHQIDRRRMEVNPVSSSALNANLRVPIVSICIPTYNGARYLEACLDSVLSQTYKDVEVLVVDDGSTDATLEILERYAACDQLIRLVRNKNNLGLVGNWNRCIELANGEWIKFVFQDDLIAPTCVEEMLAASKPDNRLIVCRREFIFESVSDDIQDEYRKFTEELSLDSVFPNISEISAKAFCGKVLDHSSANFIGEPTAVLFHRDVIRDYGNFNPNLIQLCDLEYWYRVGVNTGITHVPKTLAYFRVHAHSTTSTNNSGRTYLKDVIDLLLLQHEFAFNRFYAPLRKIAHAPPHRRNLRQEFSKKALWVHATAIEQSKSEISDGGLSHLSQWKKAASQHPRLESGMHLFPGKLMRWIEHTITWRFHA